MKIYYFKAPIGNFGDDLNLWLWQKLLPDVFDEDERVIFVGIGTLLKDMLIYRTPTSQKRIVFTSGVGVGKTPLDKRYIDKFYAVRGPLSAQALGLDENLAITDGAIFIHHFAPPQTEKKYRFSYMPHYELAGKAWEEVCQNIGYGYIDPRWSSDRILPLLCQTECLLTEAMHGAIVADALRVPWIPIVTHSTILPFKWMDWCQSLELEYQSFPLKRLHHPRDQRDFLTPVRALRDQWRQWEAGQSLQKIANTAKPQLSRDAIFTQRLEQLQDKLEQFKADIAAGMYDLPEPGTEGT